jgi:hypothetical protein
MTRSAKLDAHLTGKWVAQQARKDRFTTGCNVDFNVPIKQPSETFGKGSDAKLIAVGRAEHGTLQDCIDHFVSGPADKTRVTPCTRAAGSGPTSMDRSIATIVRVCDEVSKFRNVKTDGYDSKKEARRAADLRLLEKAGAIRNFREQVSFLLIPACGAERACYYKADFCYDEGPSPFHSVVEDCKGYRTEVYRLKRKLMLFVHGIAVRET